jgi:hypothetical protein
MQFIYPKFLFALFTLAIPIFIHLFYFRRYKKMVFSDIRFLKQITEQNKSTKKLKDLLILLFRLIALTALILAFAQPFIPHEGQPNVGLTNRVSIFIDNSLSMLMEGNNGPLLEDAKLRAEEIIKSGDPNAQYQIITHDNHFGSIRPLRQKEALEKLGEIQPVNISKKPEQLYRKQTTWFESNSSGVNKIFWISDFPKNDFPNWLTIKTDSNTQFNAVKLSPVEVANISIDSLWIDQLGIHHNENAQLHFSVTNYGSKNIEDLAINLDINGTKKSVSTINVPAKSKVSSSLSFNPDNKLWNLCNLSINDYPISFDNNLYFAFKPIEKYEVLCINGSVANKYLEGLFNDDSNYHFVQYMQSNIDFSQLNHFNIVILNECSQLSSGLQTELTNYVKNGGQIILIPSENETASLNTLLGQLKSVTFGNKLSRKDQIQQFDNNHPMFKGAFSRIPKNMDLPIQNQYYTLQKSNSSRGRSVITLASGESFLWENEVEKGSVLVLCAPLNHTWGNLTQHSFFVPMMLGIGRGLGNMPQLYHTIGVDEWIALPELNFTNSDQSLILSFQNKEWIAPTLKKASGIRVALHQDISQPGLYDIKKTGDKQILGYAALNLNRSESDINISDEEELAGIFATWNKSKIYANNQSYLFDMEKQHGDPLWRLFLLISIIAIAAEIAIIRLMR